MYINGNYHKVYGYVNVFDLLFNGGEDCECFEEKPSSPYVALAYSDSANCGRGSAAVVYKGKVVLSHFMTRHGVTTKVTIGDLNDTASLIMETGIDNFLRYGVSRRRNF